MPEPSLGPFCVVPPRAAAGSSSPLAVDGMPHLNPGDRTMRATKPILLSAVLTLAAVLHGAADTARAQASAGPYLGYYYSPGGYSGGNYFQPGYYPSPVVR